jgi:hypothetical protein
MTMPFVYDKPEADKLANAKASGQASFDAIREMVDALMQSVHHDATDEDHEAAERAIHEDPLSVEVRSGWFILGNPLADTKPAEYRILLSTGGPAVQIVGTLNEHGEPETAVMQVQDWFLPWTDYYPEPGIHGEQDPASVLLAYARCFYFGE